MTDYSIGAVAQRTGVKVPTIRYYEEIGLLGPPFRTAGQQRRYDDRALKRLGFIRHGISASRSMTSASFSFSATSRRSPARRSTPSPGGI